LLRWTEENRAWVAFGMAVAVTAVLAVAMLLRWAYGRFNRPREFGAARWADAGKLRRANRLRKDFT
jgi:hypothetical protein